LSHSVRLLLALILALMPATARASGEEQKQRVADVQLGGRLLDDKGKLLRFLGLQPGAAFGGQEQVAGDLERLGYRLRKFHQEVKADGLHFQIDVEPMRVVRNVIVKGNSVYYFDDEIIRHLTLRNGSPLPPDDELRARLDEEAAHVRQFLERDGNFGSTVVITPHVGRDALFRKRAEWVDLEVKIHRGEWYPVGRVRGEGNKDISNEELYDVFHHSWFRFGRFSLQRMREDAQKAERELRERGFPAARVVPRFDEKKDVDAKNEQVVLPVQVIEKKKVEVKLIGNRALSDKELKEQLTIYENGAYDELELAESAKAIHRYYQQHGFFEAEVTFSRRRVNDQLEEVSFFIEEGPELKVRRVDFVGEKGPLAFSDDYIREHAGLETKVFPALGLIGLGEGGYVTTLQLAQDVDRVTEFYRSQGFPQVKVRAEVARDPGGFDSPGVLGAQIAGDTGKNDLYVRFFIDEGRRELSGDAEITIVRGPRGSSPRMSRARTPTDRQIRDALKMTSGQPFTEARFTADQSRILALYRGSGRPYVTVSYAGSEWNDDHTVFTPRYRIEEGPFVTFGEILIRGNFVTLDYVVKRDLPFRAGDPFDVDRLAEGERNLQTHQIFNSARVLPVRLADHPNPVPILVTVQERYMERYGGLTASVGLSTDRLPYYYYLALSWRWDNFFGLGSQIELRGDFDYINSAGLLGRYSDVRAFGPGWRFDLTGFYRRELTYRLGEIESFGASAGLTRYLGPNVRVFGRLDIYQANISVGFTRVSGPHDTPNLPDDTAILKLVSGVAWDRRVGFDGQPNPLMPVKGWLLAASLGYSVPAFPPNTHQFFVISAQAQALAPVKSKIGDFTFIANLRWDEGFPIGESALPAVERFFAGGATTTRGYETDQLKNEVIQAAVPPLGGQPGFRVIAQGGNIRVLSTLEVQFPIAKTFFGISWPWVGAVFYDVGAVFDAWNQVRTSDFKHSVGVTFLRVLTTFGPLSLEYAYPINQGLAEERWKTNPWYSHFPGRLHLNWGIPLLRL
jgi:outer membrane protein assembly complex protein YaeT